MKKFSDRLRHIRLQRRYTQAELAQRAGLSQSAVASYESGERQSSRAIFKLATALGIEAQWLNTGKGPIASTKELSQNITRPSFRETPGDLSSSCLSTPANKWPFFCIPHSHYENLTPHNKQLLEKLVKIFIEACQTSDQTSTPDLTALRK